MKKLYQIIGLLLVFSIISTAVILVLAPDVIPAHYNAAGEVDRYGSKYEQLIFPGFTFLMAFLMLAVLHFQKKQGMPEPEQKILLYVTIFSLALFNGLGLFFGIIAINHSAGHTPISSDTLVRFVCIGTGILLMLLGNIMPKARRNAFFGLRTKWSMANDDVWQKSQRFGGISGFFCGLVMIVLAMFLPGAWNMAALIVLPLLWTIVSTAASYIYWKKIRDT